MSAVVAQLVDSRALHALADGITAARPSAAPLRLG